ncbi:MAG TPA: hypothetical protein VI759_06740, partial [Dehalococcoidia bacterium]|nr:hypothetical protein [Dehalococcoidia bacterium]
MLILGAVACGVPISDAEVKATETAREVAAQSESSSLAAGASAVERQSTLAAPPASPTAVNTTEA